MDPSSSDRRSGHPPAPGFAALFTPKIVTVLREGYGLTHLRADMVAGLTVAIVALPLSMAIAIASGVSPAQGLYAAIIGGFLGAYLTTHVPADSLKKMFGVLLVIVGVKMCLGK